MFIKPTAIRLALSLALASTLPQACLASPTEVATGTDLIPVVRELARAMGCDVVFGPGVEGTVNANLSSIQPEQALSEVLSSQNRSLCYKRVEPHLLIVGKKEQLDELDENLIRCRFRNHHPKGHVRKEFILDHNDARTVLDHLLGQPENGEVEFSPHPTMNGFYAVGPRVALVRIANEISELELHPMSEPEITEKCIRLERSSAVEMLAELRILMPELEIQAIPEDARHIWLRGYPWHIRTAVDLLETNPEGH